LIRGFFVGDLKISLTATIEPSSFKNWKIIMKKQYLYPLLFIALLLAPHVALADGFFSVSDSDVSKTQVIDYLFGSLSGGKDANVFGAVIGVFNGAVLMLAGIYLAYIYITGTAQGAHDGQFLGKRWSSMWVPIRMLLGAVLAFPSLTGGFCIAQWLVVWLALQGVGFANHIWTAYAGDSLGAPAMANANRSVTPYVIARQLFLNNYCDSITNRVLQGSGLGGEQEALVKQVYGNSKLAPVTDFSKNGGAGVRIRFSSSGDLNPTGDVNDICGSAVFSMTEKAQGVTTNEDGTTTGETTDKGFFSDTQIKTVYAGVQASNELTEAAHEINMTHRTALIAVQVATKALADAYLANPKMDVRAPIETIAKAYNTALDATFKAQASKLATANKSFQEQVKQDGWIMAGSYFITISKRQQVLAEAMDNFPKVYAPEGMTTTQSFKTGSSNVLGYDNTYTTAQNAAYELTKATMGDYMRAASKSQSDLVKNSPFTQSDIGSGQKSQEGFGDFISKVFDGSEVNPDDIFSVAGMASSSNPLTVSSNIGNKLISWANVILGVGMLAGFLNGGISAFGIKIWTMLALPGMVLTTVIPMMPYMIWMGSVLSWMVLLIECVVAAPLWAVAHMNPEGEGATGNGAKNGYSFILGLTLRPSLMVFGLIAAIIAMKPIGALINGTFSLAFGAVASGSGSMTKIISVISGAFIYAFMMTLTAKKVFELIHILPTGIMKWMGAVDSNLKDHGSEFGMVAGAAVVAGSQAVGQIGHGVGGAVGGIGKGARGGAGALLKDLKNKGKDKGDGDGGGSPAGGNSGGPGGGEGMALSQNKLATSGGGNGVREVMASNPKPLSEEAQAQVADLEGQRNDYLNKAREQNPDYGRRYQEALNADRQSKATGVKGNQAKSLIGEETRAAKQAKKDGEPLEKYQESLLKAAAKRKQAREIQGL
jgi:conjugal transfer/type IV secretion protein DotA/TraY